MGDSRREQMMQQLTAQMQLISTDSGYEFTVAEVRRWNARFNSLKKISDGPVLFVVAGPEQKTPEPAGQMTCTLTIYVLAYLIQHETDSTPTDQLLNNILADIETALMTDHTLGGYAEDALVTGVEPTENEEDQNISGLIISIDVIYQHSITDPELYTA